MSCSLQVDCVGATPGKIATAVAAMALVRERERERQRETDRARRDRDATMTHLISSFVLSIVDTARSGSPMARAVAVLLPGCELGRMQLWCGPASDGGLRWRRPDHGRTALAVRGGDDIPPPPSLHSPLPHPCLTWRAVQSLSSINEAHGAWVSPQVVAVELDSRSFSALQTNLAVLQVGSACETHIFLGRLRPPCFTCCCLAATSRLGCAVCAVVCRIG